MRVDYSRRQLFKPGVMGATGFYWIIDDSQLTAPVDDHGLFRHRQEIIDWRWKPTPLTDAGIVKDEPTKYADDAMNSLMMITQVWGPRSVELSAAEEFERSLPENIRELARRQKDGESSRVFSEEEQMEAFVMARLRLGCFLPTAWRLGAECQ